MSKRNLFLMAFVIALVTFTSCSRHRQNAKDVSKEIADTASSSDAYFRAITKIAYASYLEGENQASMEYSYIALGKALEKRNSNYEAILSFLIGVNKVNIGDYDNAVPYFHRTISIYSDMDSTSAHDEALYQKVYTMLNITLAMQSYGNYDEIKRMLPDLNASILKLSMGQDSTSVVAGQNSIFGFMPRSAFKLAKSSETSILELKHKQQQNEIVMMRMILVFASVILLLLVFIVFRIVRYNRAITRKNASAVANINILLKYRDIVERMDKESKKEVGNNSEFGEMKDLQMQKEFDSDEELYKRVIRTIIKKNLYLNPRLTRDDVISEVYVPHNKFAQLFSKYAGTTFNKYINDLRLEYAARLLRDNPEYTIEAIGEKCGMPISQTFYRNFSDKFGVTPSDFRRIIIKNNDKIEEN